MKKNLFLLLIIVCLTNLYSSNLILKSRNIPREIKQNLSSIREPFQYNPYTGDFEIILDEQHVESFMLKYKDVDWEILPESHQIRDLAGYPSVDEVVTHLQNMAAENPDFVDLTILGPSTCNTYYQMGMSNYEDYQHDIYAVKISDNPEIEEDEPNVLFCGLIHAKETISLPVPLHVMDYIIENYGSDPEITNWVDNTQIWFIPLINPDGYKMVFDNLSTSHRKNMRDNNNNNNLDGNNLDGVDLNRNFGYVWGNNNASSYYWSSLYHGPSAFSELESQYIRDFIRERKFFGAITYHSYAQKVLYPLGHLPGACSFDHEIMGDLAEEMAATIPNLNGVGHYEADQAVDFGYTCQGTMGDWGYSEQRIFAFTIELATRYIPDQDDVQDICEDNLEAALIFLDRVHHSTVTGNITDLDGQPLVAEVYVEQIDSATGMSEVEPVRSDSLFGRYYRPLLPGSYEFVFSCDRYEDVVVNDVIITDNANTELNIVFGSNYVDSVSIEIIGTEVHLYWPDEVGFDYKVQSSDNVSDGFQEDVDGEFIESNYWRKNAISTKEFYRVLKIPE